MFVAGAWDSLYDLKSLRAGSAEPRGYFFAGFFAAALLFQPFWTIYPTGGAVMPALILLYVVGLIQYTNERYTTTATCLVAAAVLDPVFVIALIFPLIFSASRHCIFMMTILFQPILSVSTPSTHLAMFFIPLMFVVGFRQKFPAAAFGIAIAAVVLSLPHNEIIRAKLLRIVGEETKAEIMFHAVFMGLTMFLTVMLLIVWGNRIVASYRDSSLSARDTSAQRS